MVFKRAIRKIASASLLIAGIAAAACPALASDKTLRAVVNADLKIIDPTWSTAYVTIRHSYLVYDNLFALNSKFEPKPQMVDSYTVSPDRMIYSFTLRKGMKWHDGTPVTAADCVASLKRWAQRNAMGQHMTRAMEGYEIVDDLTFRIKLKEKFGLVLEALAGAEAPAFMMPKRIAEQPIDKQITDPIGSGPFIMKRDEWQPGAKAVYVRNPDYIPRNEPADYLAGGKVAKLDRVEWLYIPDNNTTLSALQAGEIDYFEAPPLDFVQLMKSDPNITVLTIDLLGVQMMARPNSLFPPFDNYKARQALLYLTNQAEAMQAVVGDPDYYLKSCVTYFMCGSENETKAGVVGLTVDIEKAKALFKEAGYKGEPIVVMLPTDRPQYQAAENVLIAAMRKAGLNVDVQSQDWATITARRAKKDAPDKGGWNLFVTSQGGPDPASPLANIWFNSQCDKANIGWACDEELTKLVSAWAQESDPAKRRTMVDAIQTRAFVSVPYVNLGQYVQPIAFRSNIKGVLKAGVPVYWNIEKQ
ncbi:ABC transporter substrate-binding protein [Bosea minatitlanensis]|uniref:ABC transporter substrate-binding protein n=1 Tax=Bosea minatitlanensis TaxID=128782 RepID=A0ABW0F506_9HYPH|nr:ABC transporter substrate-binding protein [Bosea minatitlanensis]MCT4495247.1 ABC transporter substrate-binding protein [Bosea minatitlanensis]